MTLRLNGSSSGFTEIDAPAAAGSNTLTLPTSSGSAFQSLRNGSTAGSLVLEIQQFSDPYGNTNRSRNHRNYLYGYKFDGKHNAAQV